jgi:hypothetical protein
MLNALAQCVAQGWRTPWSAADALVGSYLQLNSRTTGLARMRASAPLAASCLRNPSTRRAFRAAQGELKQS